MFGDCRLSGRLFALMRRERGDPGRRVFDILLEGTSVLDEYDPIPAVGWGTADTKTFPITVEDGHLEIGLRDGPGAADPQIAAIEIKRAE